MNIKKCSAFTAEILGLILVFGLAFTGCDNDGCGTTTLGVPIGVSATAQSAGIASVSIQLGNSSRTSYTNTKSAWEKADSPLILPRQHCHQAAHGGGG
jgi:hypothetical protein